MKTFIKNGRPLVGAMYAPFCRTKYIEMSEWEKDIKTMHELGFTCLHGFSEWWRVERKKGEFDFSETDCLIELCTKYDIVPIINVATQNGVGYYMPSWLQKEYSGTEITNSDGNPNGVKSEFIVPCMDDPQYQKYATRYLEALSKHYANDNRIGGWVIWGEPCLSKNGKPICYCVHTVSRFREWLSKRYGKIEKLCELWGNEGPADYKDFSEINPPTGQFAQRGSYASWSDWQSFMCENLSSRIKEADAIFKKNGANQPTIAELFCYISNDSICSDMWSLAESADIVGVSNFCRPGRDTDIVMTSADSIAKRTGKSIFVVEANGGPRYPGYDLRTPSDMELFSEAVQMFGMGAKELMYWCYRPRLSDFEAGTYGMCRADGKPLGRAITAGKTASLLGKLGNVLSDAKRVTNAAVFYSTKALHITGADMLSQTLWQSVMGAVRLLLDLHITPCLVNEDMISGGLPKDIKLLILPFSYIMDDDTASGVEKFVSRGGYVIADCNLAFKRLCGTSHIHLPGGGLTKVFGIEKDDIIHTEDKCQLGQNNYSINIGTCLDVLEANSASVIEAMNGLPLITKNSYGDGKAFYFAWQTFAGYFQNDKNTALQKIICNIAVESGCVPFARISGENCENISLNILHKPDGSRILTAVNPWYDKKNAEIFIPDAKEASVITDNAEIKVTPRENGICVTVEFEGWQAVMLLLK